MQQSLFIKVLGMTTSIHDGEALAAIRKANEMLMASGVTWEEYITAVDIMREAKAGPLAKPEPPKASPCHGEVEDIEDVRIRKMLDFLLATVRPTHWYREVVESVNQQFVDKGWLSEKQIGMIENSCIRGGFRF